ncbi:MAG: hypothetical protein IPK30_05035 [Cellvibrionales bacterium]|nr:hypothetical protein [Cellvibrionales bacterium]
MKPVKHHVNISHLFNGFNSTSLWNHRISRHTIIAAITQPIAAVAYVNVCGKNAANKNPEKGPAITIAYSIRNGMKLEISNAFVLKNIKCIIAARTKLAIKKLITTIFIFCT